MAKNDVVTWKSAEALITRSPMKFQQRLNKLVQDAVREAHFADADSTKKSLDTAAPNLIDAQKQKAQVYKEYMEERW